MDRIKNPFSPGAGSPPPELAGREGILEQARVLLGRVLGKRPEKSILLTGLRGTVLPTPRSPVKRMLFSGRFPSTRPRRTRACSRIPSRPASSGGGEPAPGENGFLILSMTPPVYIHLFIFIRLY